MDIKGFSPQGSSSWGMKLIQVKKYLLFRWFQSSYDSTYTLEHLKSKFWGKILQPNASRVKITKQLPKIYSMRCLQQHNRALVTPDIVIYIQNYWSSWWVHFLPQKLDNWIQTSLPNPTSYTNSAKLKSQSTAYFISKELNMLHPCAVDRRTVLCKGHSILRGATQNFREFEYTVQNICATNLRRYEPLAVSFNR
jgi:hypothetical protein